MSRCGTCQHHLAMMRRDEDRFDWLPRLNHFHAFSRGLWGHKSVCGKAQR